jgi:hypothetical protein
VDGQDVKPLQRMIASTLLLASLFIAEEQRGSGTSKDLRSQAETKPVNCEFNISILTGADRVAGKDGLVIVIARLGKGERSRDLSLRRLHNARTFLTEFGQRSPQTIVTAEGERVGGYGRVELYAGGKLFHVLLIRSNDDLAVGACSFEGKDPCINEREQKLYPCRNKKSGSSKSR